MDQHAGEVQLTWPKSGQCARPGLGHLTYLTCRYIRLKDLSLDVGLVSLERESVLKTSAL